MTTDPETLKLADLALQPPVLNTNPLPKYGYDKLDYSLSGSIECTAKGRLWVCWIAGGDSEKAFLVFATSDDSGDTWSQPRMVIDSHDESLPLPRSTVGGALWLDPRGRLWIFLPQSMVYYDGRMGVWAARCDNPDAENPVWTVPQRLWHGFSLNKPIVHSSGAWLLPIGLWQRDKMICGLEWVPEQKERTMLWEAFHELDDLRMCHVLASTDEGETWERRGGVHFPTSNDFEEPILVERGDGSLWMIVRTNANGLYQSFSHDGGATWTSETPWLAHVNSRHHLQRLPSGRLLMVKHGMPVDTRPKTRSHLAAYLSEDDGATWQGGLMLDERETVSYPDAGIGPDGTIFVAYDHNRDTDGEIFLARFTEDDVLAGRCVSPGSALKVLVTRADPKAVAARHAARKEAAIQRMIGDSGDTFIHIPQWKAWDGVGTFEFLKVNVNNGTTMPGLNLVLPPEREPAESLPWKVLTPTGSGGHENFVCFDAVTAPREGILGYGRTYVYAPEAREAVFLFGADYWMQFRVNGTTFLDHTREMRLSSAPDLHEFRCDVPLRAGWNLLEVKVASGSIGFGFACQVNGVDDLRFSLAPESENEPVFS
jgi:sialidase-1